MELSSFTIRRLSDLLERREISSRQIVEDCLRAIAEKDGELKAFVSVFEDEALAAADAADREIRSGRRRGPLHGIPVAVKDLADITGWPTGFGSRAYATGTAATDAVFIERLRKAGAILLGKAQMVEFAFGSWGTNYSLGSPINPLDPETPRVAGGSSSGSGVAVAAGMVPLAIGSDTGGSVRIPASLCGIVGPKTSTGLVSMQGVAMLSHTFDTINPMARTVEDTTLALAALSDFTAASERQALSELRFAVVEEDQLAPLDATVAGSRQRFLHLLESAGCRLETFRFPLDLAEIQARTGAIMTYEAYNTLQGLIDDPAADLDPHVRQRIRGGADISAADYDGLLRQRAQDIGDFQALFAGFDTLILPTTPLVAPAFSEVDESRIPLSRLTRAGNYYDLCGISLPCTPPRQPLPTGLQLLMRHGEDARLLAAAAGIESLLACADLS